MKNLFLNNESEYNRNKSVIKVFQIDWILFFSTIFISIAGLITMNSFVGENAYFEKQIVWISISVATFFLVSFFDKSR